MTKEPFTIQAGKRYNRRDGGISGILQPNSGIHDFHDGTYYYFKDGGGHAIGSATLISEYIKSTAEPQDEWGPWQYISNEDYEVPDIFEGIETVYRDGKIRKWRIKKEPEARDVHMWVNNSGTLFFSKAPHRRKAIITTQGDNISIRWADG